MLVTKYVITKAIKHNEISSLRDVLKEFVNVLTNVEKKRFGIIS